MPPHWESARKKQINGTHPKYPRAWCLPTSAKNIHTHLLGWFHLFPPVKTPRLSLGWMRLRCPNPTPTPGSPVRHLRWGFGVPGPSAVSLINISLLIFPFSCSKRFPAIFSCHQIPAHPSLLRFALLPSLPLPEPCLAQDKNPQIWVVKTSKQN